MEKVPEHGTGGITNNKAAGYRCCFDGLSDLFPFLHQSNCTRGLPEDPMEKIEINRITRPTSCREPILSGRTNRSVRFADEGKGQ